MNLLNPHSWKPQNDTLMGGRSESSAKRSTQAGVPALRFSGHVSLENGGGFAQVVQAFANPQDFSAAEHIRISGYGDGHTYQLRLKTREEGVSYAHEFSADGEFSVTLPLSDFQKTHHGRAVPEKPDLDRSDIRELGLLIAPGAETDFSLDVSTLTAETSAAEAAPGNGWPSWQAGKNILWLAMVMVLSAVAFSTILFSVREYQENRNELTLQAASFFNRLALPLRIAELSRQPEVRELPVPVYGVTLSEITDTWGAARAEGRTHEGVDIFAAQGTPIFSVTEGYVRRVNIGTRGGQNVMVVGPGGVGYYYAHFSRLATGIEVGARVTTDTVLGFVGSSGNAAGTPPHLHLGIYPELGSWDVVKNPYPLLVQREW